MKNDLISRQAAIEAMRKAKDKSELHRMLVQLPPAQLAQDLPKGCTDTISRQAAVETVKKHYRGFDNDLLEVIAYEMERLPSAQPGWIPVTERPIVGGQYIVTLKDDKEVWTDIAEWNPTFGGRWQAEFFDCEYRDIDNVVAWMPLPEPWKGEQND